MMVVKQQTIVINNDIEGRLEGFYSRMIEDQFVPDHFEDDETLDISEVII